MIKRGWSCCRPEARVRACHRTARGQNHRGKGHHLLARASMSKDPLGTALACSPLYSGSSKAMNHSHIEMDRELSGMQSNNHGTPNLTKNPGVHQPASPNSAAWSDQVLKSSISVPPNSIRKTHSHMITCKRLNALPQAMKLIDHNISMRSQ